MLKVLLVFSLLAQAHAAHICEQILVAPAIQLKLESAYQKYLDLRGETTRDFSSSTTWMARASGRMLFKGKLYRILDFLGEGGSGSVFRVVDTEGDRFILKIMKRQDSLEHEVEEYRELAKMFVDAPILEEVDDLSLTLKFRDFRAIPLDYLAGALEEAGLTRTQAFGFIHSLEDYHISRLVPMALCNQAFDIDRCLVVPIDRR